MNRRHVGRYVVIIRPATSEDTAEWLRMRRALWPECGKDRHLLEIEQLATSDGTVFVALREDQSLCGFIEVSIRRDHVPGGTATPIPYIEGWYVDEDCRARGIGRRLMKIAEDWARNRGFREIASDAVIDNKESIRAHLSLGFSETSREVHFIKKLNT